MYDEPAILSTFRKLLLALVLLGTVGLALELLLLEHIESVTQLIPLAVLVLGFAATILVWQKPSAGSVRFFQLVMLLSVLAGIVGIFLHARGNVLFEQETDPSARGLDLVWRSLRGGIPMLAPAAMAQLGLVGLLFAFRHPASSTETTSIKPRERS